MKNKRIENNNKKSIKTMFIIISVIVSFLIIFVGLSFYVYDFILFALNDFNPDYLEIDKCMDHGHSWNYENAKCRE